MLPRGSPFLPILNRVIIKYYENGGLERLKNEWLGREVKRSHENTLMGVTLDQMSALTGAYVLVVLSSLLILALEAVKERNRKVKTCESYMPKCPSCQRTL